MAICSLVVADIYTNEFYRQIDAVQRRVRYRLLYSVNTRHVGHLRSRATQPRCYNCILISIAQCCITVQ